MTLVADREVLPLLPAVRAAFAGRDLTGPPRIGIELELFPVSAAGGPVPVARLRELLHGLPHVTFEPGGQVELNPPPQDSVPDACTTLQDLALRATRLARTDGIDLVAAGVHPWLSEDQIGLQLPSERYLAMDAHFARLGPAGRAFMRRTASTQVCVDLAAGAAGLGQWRTANLVAPVLAAVFANSPLDRGRRRRRRPGVRTRLCLAADPDRSGHGRFPGRAADPAEDYLRFAEGATRLAGRPADTDPATYHLGTLFPPVRPRGGYLEARAIDSLGSTDLRQAVLLTAVLLADGAAADAVSVAVERSGLSQQHCWRYASGVGIRNRRLRALAVDVVDAALDATGRLPADYVGTDAASALARLRRRVAAGRVPGDLSRSDPTRWRTPPAGPGPVRAA